MYITNQEIYQCQKLLHDDYKDVQLKIIHSRLWFVIRSFWHGMSPSNIREHFNGEAVGYYDGDNDIVYILPFAFRFKNAEFRKLEIIHNLYHELRHSYQWRFKPKLVKQRNVTSVKDDGYESDPTERDANRFASRMCTKYKEEISEILGVDSTWRTLY